MIRAAAIPAIATFALAIAGCGEKRETTTGGAASSDSSSASTSISETEFKLTPADAQVAGSGQVSIEVKNDGGTEHALEIEGPNGELKSKTLSPGDSDTITAALEPGTYEMYCPIDGHKGKGMVGKLVVGGGGSGGSSDDNGGSGDDNGGSSGGGGGYSRGGSY